MQCLGGSVVKALDSGGWGLGFPSPLCQRSVFCLYNGICTQASRGMQLAKQSKKKTTKMASLSLIMCKGLRCPFFPVVCFTYLSAFVMKKGYYCLVLHIHPCIASHRQRLPQSMPKTCKHAPPCSYRKRSIA